VAGQYAAIVHWWLKEEEAQRLKEAMGEEGTVVVVYCPREDLMIKPQEQRDLAHLLGAQLEEIDVRLLLLLLLLPPPLLLLRYYTWALPCSFMKICCSSSSLLLLPPSFLPPPPRTISGGHLAVG